MNAAKYALQDNSHLFPHLQHQKRIMERSFMNQGIVMKKLVWEEEVRNKRRQMGLDEIHQECSKRNDEKIKKALEKKERRNKGEIGEESDYKADKDLAVESNKAQEDRNIEPEPEKSVKRIESIDTKRWPATSKDNDENNADEKSSTSIEGVYKQKSEPHNSSNNHRYDRKRRYDQLPNQNRYAFKNPNQDVDVKCKSGQGIEYTSNRPSNDQKFHHQEGNRSNQFENRYAQNGIGLNEYLPMSNAPDSSRTLKDTMPTSRPNGNNYGGLFDANEKVKHKTMNVNSDKEAEKPMEEPEEGELTDDDSETTANKGNVASFEDYAEPISSPE